MTAYESADRPADGDQILRRAAHQVLSCADQDELLQVVVDTLTECGWQAVSVCTHLDRTMVRRAHRGLTDEEETRFAEFEPSLQPRRVLFGIEFEPYRNGRFYFIPPETAQNDPSASRGLHNWPLPANDGAVPSRQIACIALYAANNRVIGSIVLARPSNEQCRADDELARLEFFTELVAQRIETLRLIEDNRFAADALRNIVQGTVGLTGDRFFRALAQHIAVALSVKYVVISVAQEGEPLLMHSLGAWMNGQPGEPMEYRVERRPCELTLRDGYFFCGDQVQNEFPDDAVLRDLDVASYLGVALRGRDGRVLGILCVLDTEPMIDSPNRTCVLELFALRAAAELERQLTDRELLESELRFRKMVEAIPTGIAVFTGGKLVYANAEIARILGIDDAKQLSGRSVGDLFHAGDPSGAVQLVKELERPGSKLAKTDVKLARDDGEIVEAEVIGIHVEHRGEPSGQIMVYDVTNQNQTAERLRRQERELAHVARLSMLGEMVAGIIHDITQPLSAITNYASACQATLRQIDLDQQPRGPRLEEWMGNLSEAANRAGELIDRLRTFVRKTDPQRRVCRLDQILRESLNLVGFTARRQQVQLTYEPAADAPIEVEVDPVQIQQVVVNLLSNACESFDDHTGKPRRVNLSARVIEGHASVSVTDNGSGIDPEIRARIFEPFFTNKSNGMGMGLAICRTIVESHDGTLTLASAIDESTEFVFTVPLANASIAFDHRLEVERSR